ncbi:TPA: DUF2798 domain-containing protein [Providencia alcalifaciens]|uniref:DUF2798 domain-containing protein n=3 Tax=Providencia alcalifaciens TaxID=126385 RepID=A0AAW9VAB5_9GAMM|nr:MULTISPECIES: DUF2798 domain-containing protein [Providencia]ATG17909.1 DUF2798 domain-containing protein [Providencia alcalifaciens]EEB47215.1 hypothetical protein PROVALCAL_00925 [Providencia alcalifaciens DSM 30120]EKT66488.1 hypothetical protein OO9_08017 [Providencia alcalifaciens Dmel2]ETT03828.1 PF11391 family protein [Providencia alcalifaciens F90-2004]EUC95121.1 PF11391 family protein [Providencia alcalifaciens PAL-2]
MSYQDRNFVLGIPKLPMRALFFLVPFFLSLVMSGIVSLISTIRALGFTSEIYAPWMSSWGLSWMIAFPTVLFILPIARRISLLLVKQV